MTRFILNDRLVETDFPSGALVLDHIRYHSRLTGTKVGCREGDCGACTVLVGDFENGRLVYRSMTSCLMILGNANGKHIVTVEGINLPGGSQGVKKLSPVQEAMVAANGTQCGFCTTGFVMSLTGFMLNDGLKDYGAAQASIDGNICRCTGYKSIERAVDALTVQWSGKPAHDVIPWLVKNNFIPEYFLGIRERLEVLKKNIAKEKLPFVTVSGTILIGGGTDLLVQKPGMVKRSGLHQLSDDPALKTISVDKGYCHIGASVTLTQFVESPQVREQFPGLDAYVRLISSTPIRNMATMAGNLANASPIGDMSVFFLALDSDLVMNRNGERRTVGLKNFYKGYKEIDRQEGEHLEKIVFPLPAGRFFNFEKVSKRTHLDIASVNSACLFELEGDDTIKSFHLSAGGVAPFPKYLSQTGSYLCGRKLNGETLEKAVKIMHEEITPISDVRGTSAYKRLLLRQLFFSHFVSYDKKWVPLVQKALQTR
jgi:xanthine dehydrogenase small subunit